jgi:hypothetical protein
LVQETYDQGNTNAPQWQSAYCWPEGFMRRWHEFAGWEHYVMVTPDVVQILAGVARDFITNIHIGREFNMDGVVPRLGEDVPRWYGKTIGFWFLGRGCLDHLDIQHPGMESACGIRVFESDADGRDLCAVTRR